MKKSKKILSLLLSVVMLMSVLQTGFVALAADGASTPAVLSSTESAIIPDAGAVATATEIVRVASGAYSYELGNTIVAATPSGIPAMNGNYESNSIANAGNVNETAEYPEVKIVFKDLPDAVPQIKCLNSDSSSNNVLLSSPVYNEAEKSYTWIVASGTATAGDILQYKISYKYNGKEYISTAYSFVENVIQPAGAYAQTTSTYNSGLFGTGHAYRARVNAITRLIGINTYGSLESFTTSSNDYRGYYNASADSFLMRSGNNYNTYASVRGSKTQSEDNPLTYLINDRRAYADVYVDSSVTNSFADLNLRYAVTMSTTYEDPQNLDFVGAVKGYSDAGTSYVGTGDYDLGTNSATGNMTPTTQLVTTFNGETFIDGQEYTIVAKLSSSTSGAANITAFPVGLRVHVTNKAELRSLIENILHNNTPETPLVTALNKGVNPQSWYYSAGFDAYSTAMIGAQKVLNNPRATQEDIDSAVTSLTTAYNGLVLKEADYTSVEEAISSADAYIQNSDLYTADSMKALTDAMSIYDADSNPSGTIQYGYSVLYQPQIEVWAEGIYNAISSLAYRLADYDELNQVYNQALELQKHKDDFFDFSAVEAAMKAVDFNVKVTEQDKVDAMTATLNEAIQNLKYRLADYTAVNEAVSRAQSYVASNYTDESFQALRTVLRSIDYSLDLSHQAEVDAYVDQINEAIANLDELDANYEELESLLAQIDSLVEEYYYPETYQAAKQAAAECEGYRDIKITQQALVDEMTAKLQTAVDNLVMYDADYTLVNEQIERYNGIDTTDMTQASIDAVESAINNVQTGLKIDNQRLVDAYYNEIKLAIDSLVYLPADYSRVELALERASKVDRDYYSQETVQLLDNAIANVQYGLGVNRQDDINAMADAINAAIDGLKPGPADYTRVNDAIAKFEALEQSHYTPDSIAKVQAAINAVNWNLTKDQQAEVAYYALDIQIAMNELVEADADYTELNNIVNRMPTNSADYTADSYKDMMTVYQNINWNLKAKDQNIVVGYQNALLEAMANLKYRTGDYSDVDAAIAEGRAIIVKNDPPIAKESVEAFEAFVASIDRTYTIKQTSEIAALASEIRAEYAKFTYAESVHKASVRLEVDKSASYPGDIVTVSVFIGTDYYAASSSIPVLYDSNFYTLVGTTVEEAFQFEGTYATSSKQEGNINSPAKAYPSSYTDAEKAQWKIALFSLAPLSELNPNAQILNPEQKVATLQLKVRDDLTVGSSNSFNAKIWIDSRFEKTEENRLGKLYIGRFETELVNNSVVVMGQTIDLTNATTTLTIYNPNAAANYTALKAALLKTPQYETSFYTEDTYQAYVDAKAVADEVMTHESEYTVREQSIVDSAAKNLLAAFNALKLKDADTSTLEEAVNLVPTDPVDYYTEESYNAFTEAVANGNSILAETGLTIVDNARINAAAQTIINAYNALEFKPFAYTTEMENALAKIPAYGSEYYTEETYSAYDNAHQALKAFKEKGPTFLDNDEGMALIYDLELAYSRLYLKDANTEPLETELGIALDYDSSFYTEETYANYQTAVDAGNAILNSSERLTIADDERIQQAADEIASTRALLEFKPFSYDAELEEAANAWPDETYEYTDESWDIFLAASDEAFAFIDVEKDIRDDEEVLRIIQAVYDAINNMVELPADTSLLDEALSLETLDESLYTEESYRPYKEALDAVKAYGDDYYWKQSEQETLDALAQAIIDAHAGLALASFTKLADLQAAIEVTPEYPENYYQAEAYSEYVAAKTAIEEMIAIADTLTMADDAEAVSLIENYNAKLEALNSAFVLADYTDVDNAISEAGEINRDFYTNFEIVDEAIANANLNRDLTILEQETVNGYAKAIRDAIGNLNPKDGDYTVVEDAIARYADKVAEMEATGMEIDPETIAAVDEIIANIDYSLKITQADEIQAIADSIDEAVAGLKFSDAIVLKADTNAYITDDGYLRGLSNVYSEGDITSKFDLYGDAQIIVSPVVMGYGTGTLVQFVYDGVVVNEYTVVVDGDIDGDGEANAIDVTILTTHINEFTEPELACQKLAVDLCQDEYLDAIDLTIVISLANMSLGF